MRGFGGVPEENKLVETPTRVLRPEQSRNRSRALLRPTGEWRLKDKAGNEKNAYRVSCWHCSAASSKVTS